MGHFSCRVLALQDLSPHHTVIMMKITLIVLALAVCYTNGFLLAVPCLEDKDCHAGECCQRANLGKRSVLDAGLCTTVSVFGEKCYIHGSCGCASGLKCIQDSVFLDVLHLNPQGTCGAPTSEGSK